MLILRKADSCGKEVGKFKVQTVRWQQQDNAQNTLFFFFKCDIFSRETRMNELGNGKDN